MKTRILTGMSLAIAVLTSGSMLGAGVNFTVLDQSALELKSAFNADQGKVRLVMYVAPTCGGCLRGAKLSQKNLLAVIDDPNLSAFVIWAPRNGAREGNVGKVLDLVTDERAYQYWDETGTVASQFDDMFEIAGRPCAGVFMLYEPDVVWEGDEIPVPAYFEDAHAREFEQKAGLQFDAERLAEHTRDLLGRE